MDATQVIVLSVCLAYLCVWEEFHKLFSLATKHHWLRLRDVVRDAIKQHAEDETV